MSSRKEKTPGMLNGILVFSLIAAIFIIAASLGLLFGPFVAAVGIVFFFLNGATTIPNNSRAILMLLGTRTWHELGQGLAVLPFRPWLFDAVVFSMEAQNFKAELTANCHDGSVLSVGVAFSLKARAGHLIELQNDGGIEQAAKQFEACLEDCIRKYAATMPQWSDSVPMGPKIARAIVPDALGMKDANDQEIVAQISQLWAGLAEHPLEGFGAVLTELKIRYVALG